MKKYKRFLLHIALIVGVAVPLLSPSLVQAQDIEKNLACGANLTFDVPVEGSCEPDGGVDAAERVDRIVSQVINILSLIVAVVAVVMIIIGGLKYITSGGESGNVTGAKNTILYAVVGLVVVAMAQVLVRFVVDTTASSNSSSTAGD